MDYPKRVGEIAAATRTRALTCTLVAAILLTAVVSASADSSQQSETRASSTLTPLQREIEKQRQRLSSSETEERRDAVMRLGQMKRPDSSRVAASALTDASAIVRATATHAVLSLPSDEAAAALLPLLKDKDEFVRREAAYALGETRSRTAVPLLINALANDKMDSVRSSVAVALGQIGDEAAVIPLTQVFTRRIPGSGLVNKIKRSKKEENEFVRRAAAHSLGQIGSRAAVNALMAVLSDERAGDDVRREAAQSLGLIGDPSAVTALRSALNAHDPYLSRIAYEALHKIAPAEATKPR